jgi:hypothetical protein
MPDKSDKVEITVKVNGKNVPLSSISDETMSSIKAVARGKEKIPTFRTGLTTTKPPLRLLVNDGKKVISIMPNGCIVDNWPTDRDKSNVRTYYSDAKEIDLFAILKGKQ